MDMASASSISAQHTERTEQARAHGQKPYLRSIVRTIFSVDDGHIVVRVFKFRRNWYSAPSVRSSTTYGFHQSCGGATETWSESTCRT